MKELLNIKPRDYQTAIFETAKEKNTLVVLPTGLGKTLIALLLTIERQKKFPGQKVVFLAPTKPLAEQHIISFTKYLPEIFADMQLFTGQIKAPERKKIWQTADIIFSTPQCVANDLKKGLYTLEEVSLLIEDEAHRCLKNYDYNYVAKKFKEQSKNPRILGLTASPGSDYSKIKDICRNLSIEAVELRQRESPDVKQYLQEVEFEKVHLEFPSELEELRQVLKQLFEKYIEHLRSQKLIQGFVTKLTLLELQKKISSSISRNPSSYGLFASASSCAQAIKLQHAQELLETQTLSTFNEYLKDIFKQASSKKSKGVVQLVSKPEFNFIYSRTQELLGKNFEHPKLIKLEEIIKKEQSYNPKLKIIIFTQFRDTASIISKLLNKITGLKSKVFVGQAKKKDTGLSQKEQKHMIDEFSNGEINILVATSIAEEGLDIPEVNAVIFYEPVPSAIRKIQRSGRTARLSKGKVIMLLTKNTRDMSYYYSSRSREKKMYSEIEKIKDHLDIHGEIKNEEKQGSLF
jgi:ERCC4-related helicase